MPILSVLSPRLEQCHAKFTMQQHRDEDDETITKPPERERETERECLPPFRYGRQKEGRSEGHCKQCCQMAKFDPFLSLDCARLEGGGAQGTIQGKEGIKFCNVA